MFGYFLFFRDNRHCGNLSCYFFKLQSAVYIAGHQVIHVDIFHLFLTAIEGDLRAKLFFNA